MGLQFTFLCKERDYPDGVQEKETVDKLARLYGINYETLIAGNIGLVIPDKIKRITDQTLSPELKNIFNKYAGKILLIKDEDNKNENPNTIRLIEILQKYISDGGNNTR